MEQGLLLLRRSQGLFSLTFTVQFNQLTFYSDRTFEFLRQKFCKCILSFRRRPTTMADRAQFTPDELDRDSNFQIVEPQPKKLKVTKLCTVNVDRMIRAENVEFVEKPESKGSEV